MSPAISFGLTIAASALMLTVSMSRLEAEQQGVRKARTQLEQTRLDTAEIQRLRAHKAIVAPSERARQDVLAMVNEVLAGAGIPSTNLSSLENQADESVGQGGSRYRRQKMLLHLSDITPLRLGEFLTRWRSMDQVWVPTRLELQHERGETQSDKYGAKILIEATYIADAQAPLPSSPH